MSVADKSEKTVPAELRDWHKSEVGALCFYCSLHQFPIPSRESMLMPPYPTIRMLVIGHAATPVNVEAGLADCEVKYAVCVEQYKVGRVFISDSFDCNLVFAIYPPSRDEAEDKIGNANASARLAGIRGRLRTKPLESAA